MSEALVNGITMEETSVCATEFLVMAGGIGAGVESVEKQHLPNDSKPIELEKMKGATCMPGQKLCKADKSYQAGEGTYQFGDSIFASILGLLKIDEFPEQKLTIISVKRGSGKPSFVAPTIGSIVVCMVASRNEHVCKCVITHVGETRLDYTFRGVIRRQCIYERLRDSSKIETSFGVGDTVRARIVGIKENDFVLSTAEEDLGVASAIGTEGHYMVPVDWTRMECPITGESIERKVARISLDESD